MRSINPQKGSDLTFNYVATHNLEREYDHGSYFVERYLVKSLVIN